ncbi:MAG TPA: hypothetical protein VE130_02765 [Nitrososphaeraceae archaeon]|nr:hypothetical protein [Nitrososphaeraceae archaeon]
MTKILEYSIASRSLTLRNIDKSGFSIIAKEDIHIDEGDIKRIGNLFESIGIAFRNVNDLNGTSRPEIITVELYKDEAEKVISLLAKERLAVVNQPEHQDKEQIYKIIMALDNIEKKIERGMAKSRK